MKNTILLKVWTLAIATLLASSGWGFTTNKDSQVTGADFKITKGPEGGGDLTFENSLIFDPPAVGANAEPFILKAAGSDGTPVPFKITRTTRNGHTLGGWKMQGINQDFYMAFKLGDNGADNILDLKSFGDIRFFAGEDNNVNMIVKGDGKAVIAGALEAASADFSGEVKAASTVFTGQMKAKSVFVDNTTDSLTGHFRDRVYIGGTLYDDKRLHVSGRAGGSSSWENESDQRWKKDIKTLDNSLSKIAALRGVSYQWRQDEFPDKQFSEGTQIGVIAQEIEQIFPELVSENDQGYKSVSYASLVAPLIEAVKALKQQNESQQAAIDDLAARLDALENR